MRLKSLKRNILRRRNWPYVVITLATGRLVKSDEPVVVVLQTFRINDIDETLRNNESARCGRKELMGVEIRCEFRYSIGSAKKEGAQGSFQGHFIVCHRPP
jgi:hypothetical protein